VDVDGTISPIAPDPLSAYVLPGCRLALEELSQHVDLVGVLSGRTAQQARQMVGLDGIEYWGGHGVLHLANGTVRMAPEAERFLSAVTDARREIESWDMPPGVLIEPKPTAVAVHYRLASDHGATQTWLSERLAPMARARGLELLPGRMVFEIRPPGLGKGWCIQRIIHERGLQSIVYIGDDQTDGEAFAAIHSWRTAGPNRVGVTVAVENVEVPPHEPLTADFVLSGVRGVERALLSLAVRAR
jgi:trehalose 6-phosphate phosphatase